MASAGRRNRRVDYRPCCTSVELPAAHFKASRPSLRLGDLGGSPDLLLALRQCRQGVGHGIASAGRSKLPNGTGRSRAWEPSVTGTRHTPIARRRSSPLFLRRRDCARNSGPPGSLAAWNPGARCRTYSLPAACDRGVWRTRGRLQTLFGSHPSSLCGHRFAWFWFPPFRGGASRSTPGAPHS